MTSEYNYGLLAWFGRDVYIAQNVVIKRPELVSIGSHVAIDDYFYLTTAMSLGSYVHISPMCSVIGGKDGMFWVGNFCTISAGCRIIVRGDEMLGDGLVGPPIPHEHRDKVVGKQIVMDSYASLGSNVVIAPNVRIGEGAVVGANSFVNTDIPSWEIWAGSPARKIKNRRRDKMIAYGKELLQDER